MTRFLQGWQGRLRSRLRRWRWRMLGNPLVLHAADQLELSSENARVWRALGNDPKFTCLAATFPLPAGWYRLSVELEDLAGTRLDPVLYFDFGHGMHEACSVPLNFVRSEAKRHVGVVLLPRDVHGLRLDPAEAACTFRIDRLSLTPLTRIGAAWYMLHALLKDQAESGLHRRELLSQAWRRLRGGAGRHEFAEWLHGSYRRRGAKIPTYERWLGLYDQVDIDTEVAHGPLFSILLPVFNTPEIWLRHCLDSVLAQSYSHWELCIADDASEKTHIRKVLESYAAREPRIRIAWRGQNGHISAASNTALALARGDYVVLLDHDDELHPQALSAVAEALQRHPQWQMIYTDEDKIDTEGRRYDPYFKPDWNPDLLCGQNCVSHLGIYSRKLMQAVAGFSEGLEGSQDWDLALRCSERLRPDQVGHVPRVLYHWRAVAGSTAKGVDQKSYAHQSGLRALREHFARRNLEAEVMEIDGMLGVFRVKYLLSNPLPRISVVVPTRDRLDLLRQCVDSILAHTTYPDYEIVIVDNQSVAPETLDYLASFQGHSKVRVLQHDQPFNYSRINNDAVDDCRSELVCLLNNDIEVITPDWLEELAGHAMRPRTGAVGAMLYYPNDMIQHAGVVTGIHGVAAHPYSGMPRGYHGQMARAKLTQTMSAVTGACLMVRREIYLKAGGLDARLKVAFNDVDFCLRLRQLGYINIWTPFAELYHHESASRGSEDTSEKRARFNREVELMLRRWGDQLEFDPAYNPNLTLSGEPFALAFPPRDWRPATRAFVPGVSSPADIDVLSHVVESSR